ncbi:FtsX-like permease family protein [Gracilimonas mengyeensis]|uniref:Putative ABC transport system permease protein n=1 Tax=Gracilimonas mengyeensis TaxID=1302730 RepID=A0A521BFI7_9BACT|nr:ABC transporter permease [Gracilimonas mengyeensis]SMO45865.1 putative ABC transport system permease protein [Gracilimonas mengyeensis]
MSQSSNNLLWRSSWRFLLKHPWHFALSILGVALGVAVVVSIDLSNSSAEKAFQLSTEAVTGKATHQILGAGENLDQSVYTDLRVEANIRKSAPVVEGYARVEGLNRTFQVLGVDPIAEGPFRDYASQQAGIELSEFMTGNNTGMVAASTAEEMQAKIGDTLKLSVGGIDYQIQLIGLIEATDDRSQQALESILVVDVNTAQRLFNIQGQLSRIDLILPQDSEAQQSRIKEFLPEGASIVRSDSRTETVEQMTRAFEFNLQALSMLALLVGMFLIYNTMTFSVVQRHPLIGRMRALGVTRNEILFTVLKEALFIGAMGTVLGIIAGIILAQGLVQLVTQSINDLYFVLSVQELSIGIFPIAKGIVLGLGATMIAAFWPAREASQAEVTTVLKRSSNESKLSARILPLAGIGVLTALAGAAILLIPNGGIAAGYSSLLFMIVGFALITPLLIIGMAKVFRPILGKLTGLIGKMSVRGVVTELSRTSVAIAALAVAIAATVGVGVMVDSFRTTVVSWLEAQLQADIYIQPPSSVTRQADATLQPMLVDLLKKTEGVSESSTVRSVDVRTNNGFDNLVAISQGPTAKQAYQLKVSGTDFWQRYTQENIVMVSEVYTYRNNMGLGDTLRIETDAGTQPFVIQAINFDYASDIGTITISREIYNKYFDDNAISGLALYAEEGQSVETLVDRLRERSAGMQEVFIRSNRGLREASIEIFDRTFTVTIVLRMLAILVAFMGVLSALMALQLERARELAVLRANGMTPGQLWNYVISQTGVMGIMAGLLSVPLGILMAYVLVYVINLRSFGWTLQFMITPEVLLQAVGLAVVAALLAGIYPSRKMSEANPADALRNE